MAKGGETTKAIVDLLEQTSSLQIVRDFLKAKGLTHSAGSWEILLSSRIMPAIDNGTLKNSDLIQLLRQAEECGHQHVFLFSCKPEIATALMNRARIKSILQANGMEKIIDAPIILDKPTVPTIADVRWDSADIDLRMIIKIIEQRTYRDFVNEEVFGSTIMRKYAEVRERAVNVVRLHRTGILEIRVATNKNSSYYADNVAAIWKMIGDLLPKSKFSPVSLQIAKDKLWNDREKIAIASSFMILHFAMMTAMW